MAAVNGLFWWNEESENKPENISGKCFIHDRDIHVKIHDLVSQNDTSSSSGEEQQGLNEGAAL